MADVNYENGKKPEPVALFGRWCPVCKTLKAEWAFYPKCFDCKECRKARMRDYIARNPDKVKEANRRNWEELKADPLAYAAYNEKKTARRKTPEGREKLRKYNRDYQRKRRKALSDARKNGDGQSAISPGD